MVTVASSSLTTVEWTSLHGSTRGVNGVNANLCKKDLHYEFVVASREKKIGKKMQDTVEI